MNEIFSRKNLNTRYFGDKSLGRIGEEYEDKGYSYRIDIVLELKSNNLRQIPSPKKVCIASLGMKGYAIEGRNDRRRFSELIFLLAAKLKYDRLEMRRSYDGSGFLHTKEIINLNNAGVTKVAKTTYDVLRKLHDAAKDAQHLLNRFLIHRDQLWHLICHYGRKDSTTPESFNLIWWLNVSEKDISFKDVNGKDIPDEILKELLGEFFKGCLLELNELRKFNNEVIEELASKKSYVQGEQKYISDKIVSLVEQQEKKIQKEILAKIRKKLIEEATLQLEKKLESSDIKDYQPLDLEIGTIEHEQHDKGILPEDDPDIHVKKYSRVWQPYSIESLGDFKGVCILSSDVGTGKTTFLRNLQLNLLGEGKRIPIYIPVSEIEEWHKIDNISLEKYLKEKLDISEEIPHNFWSEIFKKHLVLLVDGLDQIAGTGDAYRDFLDGLLELADSNQIGMMVASRPSAVISAEENEDIYFLRLKPFSINVQKAYFGKYYDRALEICKRDSKMMGIPMLAFMIRFLIEKKQDKSIRNRKDLYERFVNYVFIKYKHEKLIISKHKRLEIRRALQNISYDALADKNIEPQRIPLEFCQERISKLGLRIEVDDLSKHGLTNFILDAAKDSEEILFFTHQSFQEYLAAEWASKSEERIDYLIENYWNPKWKETIKFLCGMDNGRSIVERIYPKSNCDNTIHSRLFFAAECAGQLISNEDLKNNLFEQLKPLYEQAPFDKDIINIMLKLHTNESIAFVWEDFLKGSDSRCRFIEDSSLIADLYTEERLNEILQIQKFTGHNEYIARKLLPFWEQYLNDDQISKLINICFENPKLWNTEMLMMLGWRLKDEQKEDILSFMISQYYYYPADWFKILNLKNKKILKAFKTKILNLIGPPMNEKSTRYIAFLCNICDVLEPEEVDEILNVLFKFPWPSPSFNELVCLGSVMNAEQINLCRDMLHRKDAETRNAIFLLTGAIKNANRQDLLTELYDFINEKHEQEHMIKSLSYLHYLLKPNQITNILDLMKAGNEYSCRYMCTMVFERMRYIYRYFKKDHIEIIYRCIKTCNEQYDNWRYEYEDFFAEAVKASSYVVDRITKEHLYAIINSPYLHTNAVSVSLCRNIYSVLKMLARKIESYECDIICDYIREYLEKAESINTYINMLNPHIITKKCIDTLTNVINCKDSSFSYAAYQILEQANSLGRYI